MKFSHVAIASLALAVFAPAAFAQEEVQGTKRTVRRCRRSSTRPPAASAEQLSQAKVAADEGKKLCSEGKTAEGAAKLKEAISQFAAPSQQPRS